jgi:hypothetical protein
LLLEANYQRERRQLAARRKAAFAIEPTGANHVWQLDFTERLVGRPLRELTERAADGTVLPVVKIVTDNGGPFRSFRFEAFIASTRSCATSAPVSVHPGQNGSRERGGPPRPGRPPGPQLSRARSPANCLTRDSRPPVLPRRSRFFFWSAGSGMVALIRRLRR